MLRKGSFWVRVVIALLVIGALVGAGMATFRWGYSYGVAQTANIQPGNYEQDQDGVPYGRGMMRQGGYDGYPPFMMNNRFGGGGFMMHRGGFFPMVGGLFGLLLVVLLVVGLVRFACRPWGHHMGGHGCPPGWVNHSAECCTPQPAAAPNASGEQNKPD